MYKNEEIISEFKIKHNTCYQSKEDAKKQIKQMLIEDGYQVED